MQIHSFASWQFVRGSRLGQFQWASHWSQVSPLYCVLHLHSPGYFIRDIITKRKLKGKILPYFCTMSVAHITAFGANRLITKMSHPTILTMARIGNFVTIMIFATTMKATRQFYAFITRWSFPSILTSIIKVILCYGISFVFVEVTTYVHSSGSSQNPCLHPCEHLGLSQWAPSYLFLNLWSLARLQSHSKASLHHPWRHPPRGTHSPQVNPSLKLLYWISLISPLFDSILPSNIASTSFRRYATAINAGIGTDRNGTRILLIKMGCVFRSFPSVLTMPMSSFVTVIWNSRLFFFEKWHI